MNAIRQATQPLTRWQRLGLVALVMAFVVFGIVVEIRTAFLQRRMGDVDVYFRGAWAIRSGAALYDVTVENGWHYNYPPLLAIALLPLANPPIGADTTGTCPFAVSVAIWYVFSVICLFAAAHWLACALEETTDHPDLRSPPWGCQRWWALRVLPVVVCLPAIGRTLARGQVNLLVLALFSGMAAGMIRGQRFRAGLCLAGAICIKVFPVYLLIYPLWRRDGRCLAGVITGLALGLAVVPAVVFGPSRAWELNRTYAEVMLLPVIADGGDRTRADELIDVTATDTQSILAVLHNCTNLHWNERWLRPHLAEPWAKRTAQVIGGILTLLTLLAGGFRGQRTGSQEVTFLGALIIVMLLMCPVCHPHYFAMAVPLVAGLYAVRWQQLGYPRLGWTVAAILTMQIVVHLITSLPGQTVELFRDLGLVTVAALLLWLAGIVALLSNRARGSEHDVIPEQSMTVAA